jgi:outer membrane scaffolding protein for murein synthesis (MipA/OmpV family)
MLLRAALLLALVSCAGRFTAAQSTPQSSPFITGQVGIFVLDIPSYPGSDERWIVPVPLVDLRLAQRIYVGGSANGLSGGAGVFLYESQSFTWTADLALTSDRPEDRTEALAGMDDRGFGVFAGSTLSYRIGPLQATASLATGLEDRMGTMGTLGLSFGAPFGGRWFGQLGGLTVFGDCDNLAWDFGVTTRQAERRRALLEQGTPGLRPGDDRAYTPECGLREIRATATLSYAFSPRISAVIVGTGTRLERGAAESPLTRERNNWEAGVGLAWRF